MYKMTYTNTIRKTGEKVTEQVVISDPSLAGQLIKKWNRQAETFNMFHYAIVSVEWLKDYKNNQLGVFSSLNDYYNPKLSTSFRG